MKKSTIAVIASIAIVLVAAFVVTQFYDVTLSVQRNQPKTADNQVDAVLTDIADRMYNMDGVIGLTSVRAENGGVFIEAIANTNNADKIHDLHIRIFDELYRVCEKYTPEVMNEIMGAYFVKYNVTITTLAGSESTTKVWDFANCSE